MSLSSMTGFGRGEALGHGVKVTIELSSVNRKQFECHISLPREFGALESSLHRLVQGGIRRGQVKGVLQAAAAPSAMVAGGLHLDLARARAQVEALRRAGKKLDLQDDLTTSLLLTLPGVVSFDARPDDPQVIWPVVQQATEQALENLRRMRDREGATLAKDLSRRCKRLRTMHKRAVKRSALVPTAYRDALARRLAQLSDAVPLDPAVLARELVVFADRADVSEELTRLASHLDQMERLLVSVEPVGRELDFLCQELLREINTVGSKANDAQLAALVVTFKAQLEALREQVQNIE